MTSHPSHYAGAGGYAVPGPSLTVRVRTAHMRGLEAHEIAAETGATLPAVREVLASLLDAGSIGGDP